MDIIYLGHSSFKITGKTGTVVTDPFDPQITGMRFPNVSADIVTVSHDHKDHNFVEGVTAETVDGAPRMKVIDGPGEYEVKGISILGFASFHDDKEGAERGNNTIYVIEIDGLRIAHLGDLGHTLSDNAITEIGNIDVLLVPVGGQFTIGPEDAVKVTRAIEPSFVIPMHYKPVGKASEMFDALSTVEAFTTALGATAETMKKLSIKQGPLTGEEMKLVVLI
jgi:L-ascorbate metabolism protein UlaG (beta-lactamase superfamily)